MAIQKSSFQFEDLRTQFHQNVPGQWDAVEFIGEFSKFNVILTYHYTFMQKHIYPMMIEWCSKSYSMKRQYELKD